MDYQGYKNLLITLAATSRNPAAECAICLGELVVGDATTVEEEATCRLPCGHIFHNDCILKHVRSGGRGMKCPLCRTDIAPDYPECWHCGVVITPCLPITTIPQLQVLMHLNCADKWSREQERLRNEEEVKRQQLLYEQPIPSPAPTEPRSPYTHSPSPLPDWYYNQQPIPSPAPTEPRSHSPSPLPDLSDEDEDDEIIFVGEVRRGRMRSRSPISLR